MLKQRRRYFLALPIVVILAVVAGAWLVAGRLVASAHRVIGPPPRDLPIVTERVASESGADLAVWRLDTPGATATVVLLHPLRGNRMSMTARARLLHEAGYSVIWPDLQAHGESRGDCITLGHLEGLDASAVVQHARTLRPDHRIAVIGRSLGGAAALLAPPMDLDALVLEAVFPTVEEAIVNRLRMRLGDVGSLLSPLLTLQIRPRLGVRPEQLRPIDRIAEVGCPVLVISGEQDEHTTVAETKRLFAEASEPKELLLIPGAKHENLYTHSPELYRDRVLGFLERTLRKRAAPVLEPGSP